MAGRGRGKSAMSFSMEQLGIPKGETLPPSVVQPSVNYPPLERKPQPIQMTAELEYLVELKRSFTEYMRESPNYVKATVLNEDIERYCDDFEEAENDETKYEAYHDWSLMPEELRASKKRKPGQQKGGNRKKKDIDIVKKLTELEKKENTQRHAEEEKDEENDEEKEMGNGVEEEEEDEMDDGTDYANEYFENGDNYYSEDDNNDDQFFDA